MKEQAVASAREAWQLGLVKRAQWRRCPRWWRLRQRLLRGRPLTVLEVCVTVGARGVGLAAWLALGALGGGRGGAVAERRKCRSGSRRA